MIARQWYALVKVYENTYKKDYVELYVNHIRKILLEEDTTRPYVSSSPSNGLESERENWVAKDPYDNRYGDTHVYIDGNLWDWKLFPSVKFSSEYGTESFPSLETLSQAFNESHLTYPISDAITHHHQHGRKVDSIENLIGMS